MVSDREMVSFNGTVRGEGLEASCTVSAMKVTIPGGGPVAYARYSIVSVTKALPDGPYELAVNGETFRLRHADGAWLAA